MRSPSHNPETRTPRRLEHWGWGYEDEQLRAFAEALPFAQDSFDAAMAVLTDHHWRDRQRGLGELRRVARKRVVLFNANPEEAARFWFTAEYLPEFLELVEDRYLAPGTWEREFEDALGDVRLVPAPIPHDCLDGFYGAFWRRPDALLEPRVRAGISVFAQVAGEHVARAIEALREDLRSGKWHSEHSELLDLEEIHLGYYVVVAER